MLVLGLDPSSSCTGYGLVRKQGRKLLYQDCGCFRPRPGVTFAARLQTMYDGLVALLDTQRPVPDVIVHQEADRRGFTLAEDVVEARLNTPERSLLERAAGFPESMTVMLFMIVAESIM